VDDTRAADVSIKTWAVADFGRFQDAPCRRVARAFDFQRGLVRLGLRLHGQGPSACQSDFWGDQLRGPLVADLGEVVLAVYTRLVTSACGTDQCRVRAWHT
jgi:hypothetical protein